jgi:hypothetical protein
MNWQLVLVVLFVAAASAYLLRQVWRSLRGGKSACGGGCGCASAKPAPGESLISSEQLTIRLRNRQ